MVKKSKEKRIKFEAVGDRRVNKISNGKFKFKLKGSAPWYCSSSEFAALQKAAPGQFLEVK